MMHTISFSARDQEAKPLERTVGRGRQEELMPKQGEQHIENPWQRVTYIKSTQKQCKNTTHTVTVYETNIKNTGERKIKVT